MLGEHRRLVAIEQRLQAREMITVERPRTADREPDAVHGQRKLPGDVAQQTMRRAAGAHVVLGMDFEEIDRARIAENVQRVLRLQTHPGTGTLKPGSLGISIDWFARHVFSRQLSGGPESSISAVSLDSGIRVFDAPGTTAILNRSGVRPGA